jgi:hypothetical protein
VSTPAKWGQKRPAAGWLTPPTAPSPGTQP